MLMVGQRPAFKNGYLIAALDWHDAVWPLAREKAAVVLALSGLYAVMSFAVSRRTREIGIRVARLAARVVLTILRPPLIRLVAGIAAGGISKYLITSLADERLGFSPALIGYLLVMLSVCLFACVVPARRALNVDPIAALRA